MAASSKPGNARPTFSLRFFLGMCTGLALLWFLGLHTLALAALATAFLYFPLAFLGNLFANGYPRGRNPLARRRFARRNPTEETALVIPLCYLLFFVYWHMLPLFFSKLNIQLIWHLPAMFGLSLNTLEHVALAMLHVFLYVNFLGGCYGTGRVSPRNCAMTACFSILLMATHFAVPHA